MLSDQQCNRVYFSARLPEVCPSVYKGLTEILEEYNVPFSLLQGTKDIWCRDFMPISDGHGQFVTYDYHPDYLMDPGSYRETISDASSICRCLGIRCNDSMKDLKLDGGNVVSCGDKVVLTAKIFEENPGIPAAQIVDMIEENLDADPVFLPWDPQEIFGHADGICRYVGDDSVLMTNYADFDRQYASRFKRLLQGRFKHVYELRYNVRYPHKDNWAYINWLQTEQVIIIPAFGCDEDQQALEQISEVYPEYRGRIEMVMANELVHLGGAFNCISWTTRSDNQYSRN